MPSDNPFKWRQFEPALILQCVRWYLRHALSYRDLEDMMRERGLCVDHTTIYRWVQRYAPEIDKRCRPFLRRTNDSYRSTRRTCVSPGPGRISTVASIPTAIPWISCCERRATGRRPSRSSARRRRGSYDAPSRGDRGQEPRLPGRVRGRPTRGTRPTAFESSPMQVSEQHHRARPPIHQTPHPADAGLQAIHHGVADLARHRDHACAPQGQARWMAKGDVVGQTQLIHKVFGLAA